MRHKFSCPGSYLAVLFLLGLFSFPTFPARADEPPTPTPRRMTQPEWWMSAPPSGPTQLDLGKFTYWKYCLVCHGDKGQGLATWRYSFPTSEWDCANKMCHSGEEPLCGFTFPEAPAILGENTLTRFATADELFDYLSARMPYQDRGALSRDEYWSLVAYLAQQRGTLARDGIVTATNARAIDLHPQPLLAPVILATGATLLALVGFALVIFFKRRKISN
ncbi:MAG: c-type cytochrome [Chloroflexi bacterium]|nr:c-type cytochrome [Chloroflexota bacterium]